MFHDSCLIVQGDASVIYCDARPIEPELRPLDVATRLDSCYSHDKSEITIFSKVNKIHEVIYLRVLA